MELSPETLAEVITALRQSTDRRRSERIDGPDTFGSCGIRVIPFAGQVTSRPLKVQVHDISVVGICVRHDEPMALGQKFAAELPTTRGKTMKVLCTVRNCRPSAEGFLIGAEYGAPWLDALRGVLAPKGLPTSPIRQVLPAT